METDIVAGLRKIAEGQAQLEKGVKTAFPVGSKVFYNGLKGRMESVVAGHQGTKVMIGNRGFNYDKVSNIA